MLEIVDSMYKRPRPTEIRKSAGYMINIKFINSQRFNEFENLGLLSKIYLV